MNFRLEAFALHNLLVAQRQVERIGATDPTTIPPRAGDRLVGYLTNVVDRPTSDDRAAGAFFSDSGAPAEISTLRACDIGDFEQRSFEAMTRLLDETRGNARDGLVVFVRAQGDDGKSYLACLKLQLGSFEGVRWVPGRPPQQALEEVDVANLLPEPKQLQKAALVPSPDGQADLRVVDDQLRTTADYWQRFLGAQAAPGERERLRRAVTATDAALRELNVADADVPISRAVAAAASSVAATAPEDFVRRIADDSGVPAAALRQAVASRQLDLSSDATITPAAARQARTTWDLGGDVQLRGPRGVVEERAEIVRDGTDTYVKVLVTEGPFKRHS